MIFKACVCPFLTIQTYSLVATNHKQYGKCSSIQTKLFTRLN